MSQAEKRLTKEESLQREEQANVTLMARTEASDDKTMSESELESESDSKEGFSDLSHSELESCLFEILKRYQKFQNKYKNLKQDHISESEARSKFKKMINREYRKGIIIFEI